MVVTVADGFEHGCPWGYSNTKSGGRGQYELLLTAFMPPPRCCSQRDPASHRDNNNRTKNQGRAAAPWSTTANSSNTKHRLTAPPGTGTQGEGRGRGVRAEQKKSRNRRPMPGGVSKGSWEEAVSLTGRPPAGLARGRGPERAIVRRGLWPPPLGSPLSLSLCCLWVLDWGWCRGWW